MSAGSNPPGDERAYRRRLAAEARRRERHVARKAGAKSGSTKLLFDPLEPRVLLNADTMTVQLASLPNSVAVHDIVVQMVDDVVLVGAQAQIVQRVQVVDSSNNGAVLALGDLSQIRSVAISAAAGADKITLDRGSFGAHTPPALLIAGDGMTAVAISHESGPVLWQMNADGSGQANGAGVQVRFTGVNAIAGGGADVLDGPAANTTWLVNGPGAGTLVAAGGAAMEFSGFTALAGAPGVANSFQIYAGGAMPGGIAGGGDAADSLAYVGGTYQSVVDTPTGPTGGSITADGTTLVYSGMDPVLPPTQNVSITLTVQNDKLTLSDLAGSSTQLQLSDAGDITDQIFTAPGPGGSVSIDLGPFGGDTLTLSGIDSRFASSLAITDDAAMAVSTNTVDINTNLATQGGSLAITTGTITLESNSRLDTRTTIGNGGNAGNVSFAGAHILLDPGSQINATAPAQFQPGAVSLQADDTTYNAPILPFDWTIKSVGVTLDGTSIMAGNVLLSSQAQDLSVNSEVPVFGSGQAGTLLNLLQSIPGDVISYLTGSDASVIYRGAEASTSITGTTIVSSGDVTVEGNVSTASSVLAAATQLRGTGSSGPNGAAPLQVSVGIAVDYGTVDTSVTNSVIDAAGDVTITSTDSAAASANAQASANTTGSNAATNSNAVQVAVAIAVVNLDSTAEVDNASRINAGGNVNLAATGSTSSIPQTATTGYQGGKAGIDISLGFDNASVTSFLNGTVKAGGAVSATRPPSAVTARSISIRPPRSISPTARSWCRRAAAW